MRVNEHGDGVGAGEGAGGGAGCPWSSESLLESRYEVSGKS